MQIGCTCTKSSIFQRYARGGTLKWNIRIHKEKHRKDRQKGNDLTQSFDKDARKLVESAHWRIFQQKSRLALEGLVSQSPSYLRYTTIDLQTFGCDRRFYRRYNLICFDVCKQTRSTDGCWKFKVRKHVNFWRDLSQYKNNASTTLDRTMCPEE